MITILIVEANNELAAETARAVENAGYKAVSATGEEAALAAMQQTRIDMILADADADACELCRELREVKDRTPFLVLISDASKRDVRQIYHSGTDGYVALPFDAEELGLRMRSLLWRCNIETETRTAFGNCSLSAESYSIETPGGNIELAKLEFQLLEKLISFPGRVFTRAQLMEELWGYDCESNPRTVDTHIKRLRKKLREVDGVRIQTVRGIGYRAQLAKRFRE